MFRKRESVVYPKHGIGKIIDKYKTTIDEIERKYYKIKFYNSPVKISVPIKDAGEMGLRQPNSRYKTRKIIKKLGKKVSITNRVIKNLDKISKEHLLSGKLESAVKLFNIYKSLAKKKEKENKNFSYSASQRFEITKEFIKSEVGFVLGKTAAEKIY